MDFDHLTSIAEDQDKGRWLTLVEPYEGKTVGVRLLIAGPDSNVQARARLKLADEMAEMADDEGRVSAENRENLRIRNLARCVIGWDITTPEGKKGELAFTFDNVRRLLAAGRWVQEQVDDFAGSRRAFAKGEA